MYKLIRFFNQNRKKIVRVILIIAFAFIILQLLNYFTKNKGLKNIENTSKNNITTSLNNNDINYNNNSLLSDKSTITGNGISTIKLESDIQIIDKFMNYCNNKEIENAYNLLTDECKEEMFSTIQEFYDIYYSKIFYEENKTYTVENWIGNTYTVRITGDILATGNIKQNNTKQDYITIVEKDKEKKLNINNYIGRKSLKKETINKDIKIIVNNKDTYMDYEIYDLTIENNSKNTILLDTNDDTQSVYLLDSKNMKYYFFNNEIIKNKLKIKSQLKTNLKIKFNNSYSSTRKIKNLVFSKMVLNYNEYIDLKNKEEYSNFYSYFIEL